MAAWHIAGIAALIVILMGFIEYKARERYNYAYYQEVEADERLADEWINLILRNGSAVIVWFVIVIVWMAKAYLTWWSISLLLIGAGLFSWTLYCMVSRLYMGRKAKRTMCGRRATLLGYTAPTPTQHGRK